MSIEYLHRAPSPPPSPGKPPARRERVDDAREARGAKGWVLVGEQHLLAFPDPQTLPSIDEVLRLGKP